MSGAGCPAGVKRCIRAGIRRVSRAAAGVGMVALLGGIFSGAKYAFGPCGPSAGEQVGVDVLCDEGH